MNQIGAIFHISQVLAVSKRFGIFEFILCFSKKKRLRKLTLHLIRLSKDLIGMDHKLAGYHVIFCEVSTNGLEEVSGLGCIIVLTHILS
jgi:hypothetical protein